MRIYRALARAATPASQEQKPLPEALHPVGSIIE
jgi:hypothetical protein